MPEPTVPTPPDMLFADRDPQRAFPLTAVAIAAAALVILAAMLLLLGRRHGAAGATGEDARYALNIQLSNLQMSESESLSGGKSTYIDGHLTNRGPLTVTGVTVRVGFPAGGGARPQVLTVPVQLIRMREPYVDVGPIGSAPIRPGAGADFRLIFEGVSEAWNQQTPDIEVRGVSTR